MSGPENFINRINPLRIIRQKIDEENVIEIIVRIIRVIKSYWRYEVFWKELGIIFNYHVLLMFCSSNSQKGQKVKVKNKKYNTMIYMKWKNQKKNVLSHKIKKPKNLIILSHATAENSPSRMREVEEEKLSHKVEEEKLSHKICKRGVVGRWRGCIRMMRAVCRMRKLYNKMIDKVVWLNPQKF